MTSIKDRELLAFCSLSKLKLEFSEYKEEEDVDNKPVIKYKTIRELLDQELDGQNERRISSDPLVVELRSLERKVKVEPDTEKKAWLDYHDQVQKIKDPENKNKINIGMFYDSSEVKKNPLLYRVTDDLRRAAPMLMEYYDSKQKEENKFLEEWEIVFAGDSYDISKRIYEETIDKIDKKAEEKKNKKDEFPERKNLKEYLKTQKNIKLAMSIIDYVSNVYGSKPGKELRSEPQKGKVTVTSEKVVTKHHERNNMKQNGQKNDKNFKTVEKTTRIINVEVDGKIVRKVIIEDGVEVPGGIKAEKNRLKNELETQTKAEHEQNKKAFEEEKEAYEKQEDSNRLKSSVDNFVSMFGFKDKVIEGMVEWALGDEVYRETDDFVNKELLEYSIPLDINGINIVILRRKETEKNVSKEATKREVMKEDVEKKEYILVIEDNILLSKVNKKISEGMIPREIYMLKRLIKSLREEFGEELMPLVLTGTDTAGKLAAVLNLALSDSKDSIHRGFYGNKPDDLAKIPELTYGDISHYLEGGINYENYSIADELTSALLTRAATILTVTAVFGVASASAVMSSGIGWFMFVQPFITKIIEAEILEKHYKNLLKKLKELKIINSNDRVSEFKETYPFEVWDNTTKIEIPIQLKLENYIQMIYYRDILKLKIYMVENLIFLQEYKVGNSLGSDTWEVRKITRFMIYRDNELTNLKIHEFTYYVGDEESVKTVKNERYGDADMLDAMEILSLGLPDQIANKDKELKSSEIIGETQEDSFGKSLKYLLELFKNIQDNFDNIKNEIHYIKDEKPVKLKGLASIEKAEKGDETKDLQALIEYNYFPYISKAEGKITQNLRDEYIGSFIRSIYSRDRHKIDYKNEYKENRIHGKYFDRSPEPITNETILGTDKENVNEILKMEVDKYGEGLPHYNAVKNKLESENSDEILHKFWRAESYTEKGEKKRILILGHLKENKFDKQAITYSYSTKDQILSRAVSLSLTNRFKSNVGEAMLTQVADGAILKCSAGEGILKLIVTSHSFSYLEKNLEATAMDKVARVNIVPLGTLCKAKKNDDCMKHILLGEWQEIGEESDTEGMLILLSKSYIECNCGGTIKIQDANTKIKSE